MSGVVPGEYIIALEEGTAPVGFIRAFGSGVTTQRIYKRALNGFAAKLTPEAAERMRNHPLVKHVEPNPIADETYAPITDTYPGWALERISSNAAGTIAIADKQYQRDWSRDGAGVIIYMIDHGYPRDHMDFEGIFKREGYIPPGTIAADYLSHHSHQTSSCVAGRYSGLAKRASLTWSVAPTGTDVIATCDWIMENHPGGPGVCNMSLGFSNDDGSPNQLQTVDDAIQSMIDFGIMFVCSAGNRSYEAGYHTPTSVPGAIVVGSFNEWGTRTHDSNWGSAVDIWAPGAYVKVATPDSYTTYDIASGTSYSSAYTAGGAAVIWSENLTWTRQQVETELINRSVKGAITGMDVTDNNRILYLGSSATGQIHAEYVLVYVEIVSGLEALGVASMTVEPAPIYHTGSAIISADASMMSSGFSITTYAKSSMAANASMSIGFYTETSSGAELQSSGSMSAKGAKALNGVVSMGANAVFGVIEATTFYLDGHAGMTVSAHSEAIASVSASGQGGVYAYPANTHRGYTDWLAESAVAIIADKHGEIHMRMSAESSFSVWSVIEVRTITVSVVDISKPTVLSESTDTIKADWQLRRTGLGGKVAQV